MATKQSSTPPSFFNILEEGVVLPSQNGRLFLAVFALVIASTSLTSLFHDITVEPVIDKFNLDAAALGSTNPRSLEFTHITREVEDDTRSIALATISYLLFAFIVDSIIHIIVLFAVVTTYSGELHTFSELLGKARRQLKGPLLTSAFVYALEIALFALLGVLVLLLVVLMSKRYFHLLFVDALILLLG